MRRAICFSLSLVLLTLPVLAEESPEGPHMVALRKLSINRSLLTKAEDEYKALAAEGPIEPGSLREKKMSDLRYKIQAFNEDAERLRQVLPPDVRPPEPEGRGVPVDVEGDKKAEKLFREVYRLHEKALGLVAEDRFEEAVKVYEEIILVSPDDGEAYLLLGHTCLAAHQYEKAGSAFRSALDIDPANMREIPRLYENILLENPSDDEALTQLGYAQLLLGGAEEARQAFEDALRVNPSNEYARRGMAELSA